MEALAFIPFSADMAELADAPDLGSGGQLCRFESCYPHSVFTALYGAVNG